MKLYFVRFVTNSILKSRFHLVRKFSSVDSKTTQLKTSMMSNLKKTPLTQISEQSYQLFQEYVQTDEVKYLNDIFREGGFEIRLAGGGVRDLLSHIIPNDIDFATDARPDQMINMMSDKTNIRIITTPSGKKHGTVTARIDNKVQYEITTLRIDKQTDGRHAEVEFVNDWKIDASRRDLTINSMFIDLNGILYDYFDGENDLNNKRIRFVGDTQNRIREDYLRIFRYFRFHTRFGLAGSHDPETIATMKNNVDGLSVISGERIWSELKRILLNIECTNSVEMMFNELEMGHYMGFPSCSRNLDEFYKVQQRLAQLPVDSDPKWSWKPQTLFSSLITNCDELCSVVTRLKLSNYERDMMLYIITNRDSSDPFNSHILKTQLALSPKPNQPNLREHILQYLYYMGSSNELIAEMREWTIPVFPFNGHMVANRVQQKRQISELLNELKVTWANNDFDMTEHQMQEEVDRVLKRITSR